MSVPGAAELAALPLNVLVRDYPESLAVLRRFGVDVPGRGGVAVSRALAGDAGPLLDAVLQATRWRAEYRGRCRGEPPRAPNLP